MTPEATTRIDRVNRSDKDAAPSVVTPQFLYALIKLLTVCAITALSARSFPAPVRLSSRGARWRSREVADWIRTQA